MRAKPFLALVFTCTLSTPNSVCRACDGVSKYQDQSGQTTCKTVTTCPSGQTETVAPTPSTNRQCRTCTVCSGAQAQLVPCTATTDRVCVNCHASCAACSGPSETQCTSCPTSKELRGGRCTDNCADNSYFDSSAATCKNCHTSCFKCTGPSTSQCTACSGSLYLSGTQCLSTCPANTYQLAATNDNQCFPCSACPSGKYRSGGCHGASDSVCSAIRTCSAGSYASVSTTRGAKPCISLFLLF